MTDEDLERRRTEDRRRVMEQVQVERRRIGRRALDQRLEELRGTNMATSNDELTSWIESRKLIVAQLANMDISIRELSVKMDRYNEAHRERVADMAKENQVAISDMDVRLAMLEIKAKIWGGVVGLIAGAVATGLVDLVTSVVWQHSGH